jgi:UDP-glucose 4-epimerase
MTVCWVVGRGGLLGRNVEASLVATDPQVELWRPEKPIDWGEPQRASADLRREAAAFFQRVARSGRPWRLLWCAGAGVIATSSDALAVETSLLSRFLRTVADRLSDHPPLVPSGSLFFASSAGGVYAASRTPPPFDEFSAVSALAPYGREKLIQEELFARHADECGVDLLVGRLSNLYGPGQNLSKPQGLIAHVGRAALRREPVPIYVPLDTIRDYLFAADAGRMVAEAIERREDARRKGAHAGTTTKIFASEVQTTVASVLGTWRQVLRHPLLVALASAPESHLQPRILSFRSRVSPDVRGQPTPLALGVDAVRRDQLDQLLAGGAPRASRPASSNLGRMADGQAHQ